jgi:hypothetical protein
MPREREDDLAQEHHAPQQRVCNRASRNALARAVCFHRLRQLRDRTVEAQRHRAGGLTLVTAAIVLWNTVCLGRAFDAVRHSGETAPDALLAHLAPLGWQHINLTGDYLWDADSIPASDEFRPMRHMSAAPLEATAFPVRATNRVILPVLWREPFHRAGVLPRFES